MLKKTVFRLLVLTGLTAAIFSCKKDNSSSPSTSGTGSTPTCYPTRINLGDRRTEATWDENNHLKKVAEYNASGRLLNYVLYTYSGENLVRTDVYDSTSKELGYNEYTSSGGNIVQQKQYLGSGSSAAFFSRHTYTYSNGKLVADSAYTSFGETQVTLYTYNAAGNISRKEILQQSSGKFQTLYYWEMEYDSKKNPYYKTNLEGFDYMNLSPNNVSHDVEKKPDGSVLATNTYVYEYNSNNYPTKRTINSATASTTYEYNCK